MFKIKVIISLVFGFVFCIMQAYSQKTCIGFEGRYNNLVKIFTKDSLLLKKQIDNREKYKIVKSAGVYCFLFSEDNDNKYLYVKIGWFRKKKIYIEDGYFYIKKTFIGLSYTYTNKQRLYL